VISELPTQFRELCTHELVRIVWGIESAGALRWAQRCEAPRVSSRQIHLLNERNDGDRDSVTQRIDGTVLAARRTKADDP
jgi:hypothetical protein